jgi:hypothetical protein
MTPLLDRIKSGAVALAAGAIIHTLGATPVLGQTGTPNAFEQMAPGLLGRTVFKTEAGNTTVEIIDLIVGPGKASEAITLKGGAVLDVQGGEATLLVDGKQQRVRPGNTVALAQNQNIVIDNSRATRSLVARLILLSRPGG